MLIQRRQIPKLLVTLAIVLERALHFRVVGSCQMYKDNVSLWLAQRQLIKCVGRLKTMCQPQISWKHLCHIQFCIPRARCSHSRHDQRKVFRCQRLHAMHTKLMSCGLLWSSDPGVCPSVCHAASLGFGVQKQLNGSRSCLGVKILDGPRNTVLDRALISLQRGGGWVGGNVLDGALISLQWGGG